MSLGWVLACATWASAFQKKQKVGTKQTLVQVQLSTWLSAWTGHSSNIPDCTYCPNLNRHMINMRTLDKAVCWLCIVSVFPCILVKRYNLITGLWRTGILYSQWHVKESDGICPSLILIFGHKGANNGKIRVFLENLTVVKTCWSQVWSIYWPSYGYLIIMGSSHEILGQVLESAEDSRPP